MKTLIINPDPYPPGPASARHAQLLARGLRIAGGDARIIGLLKTPTNGAPDRWEIDSHGVPYKLLPFLNGRLGKLGKIRSYFSQIPGLYRDAIEEEVRNGLCDSVIIFGNSWYQAMPSVKACKRLGIAVLPICTEWWRFARDMGNFSLGQMFRLRPLAATINYAMNQYCYWDHKMFRLRLLPRADGIIAISRLWENYSRSHNMPVVRLPSLGDDCPVEPAMEHKPRGEFRLVYVGAMFRRDLPKTLLAGVREALRRGSSVRFIVIGRADVWPEAKRAQLEASTCPVLRGHVEFTGWISEQAMDEQRRLANAFVLLRADEWETKACFPTRLPEFLLTTRPVILSAAGDIPLYLQHRRDAWLLPQGDRPHELADAIAAMEWNPEEARRIGCEGRETALREFSFRVQGPKLMEFLKTCRCK